VELETIEDAQAALDQIRRGVLSRNWTAGEANAASKATSEWVKAWQAGLTGKVVNELQKELAARQQEIEELRRQLGIRKVGS